MKKSLDTAEIMNELRGQSVFFPNYRKNQQQEPKKETITPTPKFEHKKPEQKETHLTERYHDTTIPSNHDTTVSEDEMFELTRKAVKQIGKEAATHRFTLEEKNMLADIEYSYRRQGIRTSENEIARIAVNYLSQEYRKNGENSILAKAWFRVSSDQCDNFEQTKR
jgi:hypothetical protein